MDLDISDILALGLVVLLVGILFFISYNNYQTNKDFCIEQGYKFVAPWEVENNQVCYEKIDGTNYLLPSISSCGNEKCFNSYAINNQTEKGE